VLKVEIGELECCVIKTGHISRVHWTHSQVNTRIR